MRSVTASIATAVVVAAAIITEGADGANPAAAQQSPAETEPTTTTTTPPPQRANTGGVAHGGTVQQDGGDVTVEAHHNDTPSGNPRPASGTAPRECVYVSHLSPGGWRVTIASSMTDQVAAVHAGTRRVAGESYKPFCRSETEPDTWIGGDFAVNSPGEPLAPEAAAEQALATINVPAPTPVTSPGLEVRHITGLPSWLWLDATTWQPLTADATADNLTVTAIVTPSHTTWNMGEGHGKDPVTCQSPGTPYDPDIADDVQRTDCSYTYQWASDDHDDHDDARDHTDGLYHATVTTTWTVTWAATDTADNTIETGTLADIERTTPFTLAVGEFQAVVTYHP